MGIVGQSYSDLLRRSINAKKLSRKFPILAASHRAIDGALIGFVLTVVLMSIVSLHAQHLWTLSFSRLEASRSLIHKLKESISMLESHFLISESLPKFMVVTKSSDLLYLDEPDQSISFTEAESANINFINKIIDHPTNHGY